MKKLSTWVSLVVLILRFVSPVQASSCPPPESRESPAQNLQHSDVVFSGEVINIEPTTMAFNDPSLPIPGDKVTFNVLESWKGVDTPTVVLEVSGFSQGLFKPGQRYLVYAYYGLDFQSAPLTTDECKGNKLLGAAYDDLHVLGAGSMPLQPATEASGEELATGKATRNVPLLLAVGSLLFITMSIVFFLRQRRQRM